MSKKGLGKFALGAGLGSAIALLFAPKKGEETRADVKKKIEEFTKDLDKMKVEEIKEEFTDKVEELKKELEDLDKEKIVKEAKKKGKELEKKAEELLALAKEKGTPVLEGIAGDLKEKVSTAAKDVVKKLEEK